MDWTNLTATAAIVGLFAWMVTTAIPRAIEKFQASLDKQRDDFREELARQRQESIALASEAHAVVRDLSSAVADLRHEVHRIGDCIQGRSDAG